MQERLRCGEEQEAVPQILRSDVLEEDTATPAFSGGEELCVLIQHQEILGGHSRKWHEWLGMDGGVKDENRVSRKSSRVVEKNKEQWGTQRMSRRLTEIHISKFRSLAEAQIWHDTLPRKRTLMLLQHDLHRWQVCNKCGREWRVHAGQTVNGSHRVAWCLK